MVYCDYSAYLENGGQATEADIAPWLRRASRKIDRLTYGRAERYADKLADELGDACARIADLMYAASEAAARTVSGLSSVTNDGASESYTAYSDGPAALQRECYAILADALGADRYGLLYAGLMSC